MNYASSIKARKALTDFWKIADLKGRCWGVKSRGGFQNPFLGSNIVIGSCDEIVLVSQNPDGSLRIHDFVRKEDTSFGTLGRYVQDILEGSNLKIVK